MNKRHLGFIVLLLVQFLFLKLHATHDVGGNISYRFLGDPDGDGQYTYELTLTSYQDCGSQFWHTQPGGNFPLSVQTVGVYEGFDTSSVLNIVSQVNLNLLDSERIEISLPSGCPSPPASVCVYEVTYRGTVDLPITFQGYHFVFDKCCRNVLTNIPSPQPPSTGGTGIVYHAWTSGPLTGNSSPRFTDLSVPFICVGDTTPILNTAIDPDGDQLLFSFERPYDGLAQNAGFNPPPTYNWPPSLVPYFANYNETAPFGPGGYAFVNGFTGYTEYFTPTAGSFGVTVQIKELNANGNLVGLSRRHYQFQALINCPVNKSPKLSNIGSSGQTSHVVEEGDSLCFDIIFNDPDGDSLNFNSSITGSIFDASVTNPVATTSAFTFGDSTATSQFCWNTGCSQGRSLPYQFTATVKDNGCYPREASAVYRITVNDFNGPTAITGQTSVCAGSQAISYTTDSIAGASYQWTIIGGTQVAGSNTNSIAVDWGNGPGGTVQVRATSEFGCPSDPIDIAVTVLTFPFNAGKDTSICVGDTAVIGGNPTAPNGFNILWTPSASLSNDTIANPFAFPSTSTTYFLQVTDTQGCQIVDSVRVTVGSIAGAFVSDDTTICAGDIIQLQAGGGTSYSWSPSTGLSASNIPKPTVNISSTQTYVVTISNGSPCPFVDSVTITVFNPSLVDAGTDTAICLGNSVRIGGNPTSTGGSSFLWTPGGLLNNDTIANPTFNPTLAGTFLFRVTATLNFGCTATDSILVVVNPSPNVQINANRSRICEGDTTLLRAIGAANFLWSPFNVLSDSIGSQVIASPSDSTIFIVIGTDINGCFDSDSVFIAVEPLPEITTDSIIFLCSGDTVQLDATLGAGISYSWSANPAINFLSANNIRNPFASHAVPGSTIIMELQANKSFIANCANIDTCILLVDTVVPTDAGADTLVCFPDSVSLGGNPTGFQGTQYAWTNYRMNDSTQANPIVSPDVSFTYVVNTQNGTCVGSDTVFVRVKSKPEIEVTPDSSDFCLGGSVQLNTNIISGTIQSYQWSPSDSLSNDTIPNPIAFPDDSVLYVLTVIDTNQCYDQDTAFVAVYTSPPINIYDTTICEGDSVQYINDPKFNYSWSPTVFVDNPTIPSPKIFPNVTSIIRVEVSNTAGCFGRDSAEITVIPQPIFEIFSDTAICIGDTAQLRATGASPASFIRWSPGTGLDNPASFTPMAFPTATTTYTATLSNAGICPAVKSLTVTVNPIPTVDAGPDVEVCVGSSIQLSASGASTYLWTPNIYMDDNTSANPIVTPLRIQPYVLTGFDNIGCSDTDTMLVSLNPLPSADAGPDRIVCNFRDIATIGGNPSAAPGNSTNWNNPTLLDDPNIPNPSTQVVLRREFILQVTDSNLCRNSDTVVVDVFDLSIAPIEDQCPGIEVQMPLPDVIGTEPFSYEWLPGSAFNDSSLAQPLLSTTVSSQYAVVVTDSNNCSDTSRFDLFIKAGPQARFDFNILADCDEAVFVGENQSIDADSILWKFGSETSLLDNPEFRINYNAGFQIDLIAWRDNCPDTSMVSESTLGFDDYYQLSPPNVFTPNFDGINDLFEVNKGNRLYSCTQVYIYNRWGQLIFSSQGPNHAWDGRTFAGEEATEGVYFYVVEVNGATEKGHVTLIR